MCVRLALISSVPDRAAFFGERGGLHFLAAIICGTPGSVGIVGISHLSEILSAPAMWRLEQMVMFHSYPRVY